MAKVTPKILVVDDEEDILEIIKYNLEFENFEVITATNGKLALKKLSENPDLIILDVMMPEIDGYEVCRQIKGNNLYRNIPIIMLTAKVSENDEIKGLELGADDYITKPVPIKKLIARVKSNLRQSDFSESSLSKSNFEIGVIKINRDEFYVSVAGTKMFFPRKEFEIIYYLAKNAGKVIPRAQILNSIWGKDVFVVDRTIDVHIRKIREKLGEYADLIETVKGVGYRFKT